MALFAFQWSMKSGNFYNLRRDSKEERRRTCLLSLSSSFFPRFPVESLLVGWELYYKWDMNVEVHGIVAVVNSLRILSSLMTYSDTENKR